MSDKFMINKEFCKFENGYIVDGNEIVGMPLSVVMQLDKLELMCQQYEYLKAQPKACHTPLPTLKNFKRKSALHAGAPQLEEPETPTIDRKVAEAQEFMDELDLVCDYRELNKQLEKFGLLFDWLDAKKFAEGDCTRPMDLPTLGNPLELTKEQVVEAIKEMYLNPVAFDSSVPWTHSEF